LLGLFLSLCEACRWARPLCFALENALRTALRERYFVLRRVKPTIEARWEDIKPQLSAEHRQRIPGLIAREMAALLWRTRQRIPMTASVREQLRYLHSYLSDFSNPWSKSIGHIIPRDPAAVSFGDASFSGSGAVCPQLHFWICVQWSPEVQRRTQLPKNHPESVHINNLEFVAAMLQLAAAVVRFGTPCPSQLASAFPNGYPSIPILKIRSDNTATECWTNRTSTASRAAQTLIRVYAELLRLTDVGCVTEWIAGTENTDADYLSRLDLTLPLPLLFSQMSQKLPRLPSWDYFLPAPELISILESALLCDLSPEPPVLPSRLGRFEATSSIFSNSSMQSVFPTTI
jgi:hypothetical protein